MCIHVYVFTCIHVYIVYIVYNDAMQLSVVHSETTHFTDTYIGHNWVVLTWRSSQSIRLTARRPALLPIPTFYLPSVYSQCTVPDMAYNVFSGTLNPTAPFTRHNLLSNRLSTGSTGCTVYTNTQPVVKPVWQPVWQPAVSCKQISNRLYNRFDNRLDVCLHDTTGCQTDCTIGCIV